MPIFYLLVKRGNGMDGFQFDKGRNSGNDAWVFIKDLLNARIPE